MASLGTVWAEFCVLETFTVRQWRQECLSTSLFDAGWTRCSRYDISK